MDGETFERLLTISILILSTAFHEMAHAFTATRLGDPTPARHGRLTLNPIPHLSPVLTAVILPLVMYMGHYGFMILASTPIDPSRFRKPLRDHAIVAVAGPITNVICGLILMGVLWIPGMWNPHDPSVSMLALLQASYLNFLMAVFNMLPFPPLDGYWIVRGVFPLRMRMATDSFARTQMSFLLVMFVGGRVLELFVPFVRGVVIALIPQ